MKGHDFRDLALARADRIEGLVAFFDSLAGDHEINIETGFQCGVIGPIERRLLLERQGIDA